MMVIFGALSDLKQEYKDNENLHNIFEYLEESIKKNTFINKRIISLNLDQYEKVELTEDVFAIEQSYMTRKREDSFFESHIKYVDIQFLVKGSEVIEIQNIDKLEETAPYNEKDDYKKYDIDTDASRLLMTEGSLAIFFPKDGHMPAIQTKEGAKRIFKTVVKVPISFFNKL